MPTAISFPTGKLKPLPRSFYLRPTITVAKDLLGKYLVRTSGRSKLAGVIVEVEAYLGEKDPASHAYRGKTNRNEVMFRKGGHLYVYFTYGMHFCANVVTGPEGVGHAVLLRALEPASGIEIMRRNRGGLRRSGGDTTLTNGPARLCQALGIGRKENGSDLVGKNIFIADGKPVPRDKIASSRRIGITRGVSLRWRFFLKGNPWVSR